MIKKMKLFPKTFLFSLTFMLAIIIVSHLLIYYLLPAVYNHQQQAEFENELTTFTQRFQIPPEGERLEAVGAFASDIRADVAVYYDDYTYQYEAIESGQIQEVPPDGEVHIIMSDSGTRIVAGKSAGDPESYFYAKKTFAGNNGYIEAAISRQPIEDAVGIIIMILPFTALACALLSVLFALLYSRTVTKPMKQISAVTEQMRELDPDAHCEVEAQDEIGVLADNVNTLYSDLRRTIGELEKEMLKVAETETLKTDFLRAASHELKTPVAAISTMLENMLLGVGKYKDHDVYLAKCEQQIDRLGVLTKEILDTSKLDDAALQEAHEVDIATLVTEVARPYRMIAKAKGIVLDIDTGGSFTVRLPVELFQKAVSNTLSNAVAYTPTSGNVLVYLDDGCPIVENECIPIEPENLNSLFEPFYRHEALRNKNTSGNGLGLYITSTILKLIGLEFSFMPTA